MLSAMVIKKKTLERFPEHLFKQYMIATEKYIIIHHSPKPGCISICNENVWASSSHNSQPFWKTQIFTQQATTKCPPFVSPLVSRLHVFIRWGGVWKAILGNTPDFRHTSNSRGRKQNKDRTDGIEITLLHLPPTWHWTSTKHGKHNRKWWKNMLVFLFSFQWDPWPRSLPLSLAFLESMLARLSVGLACIRSELGCLNMWTIPPMDHLQMLHTAEIQHIPRNWSSSWRILEVGISKYSTSTNISDPKKPAKVSHLVALLASGWAVKPCRRVGRCMTQNISCHARSAPFYRLYPVVSYVRPAVQFLLQTPFSTAAKWTNLESKFTWLSQRKLQT